jgi:hypothetical protein
MRIIMAAIAAAAAIEPLNLQEKLAMRRVRLASKD